MEDVRVNTSREDVQLVTCATSTRELAVVSTGPIWTRWCAVSVVVGTLAVTGYVAWQHTSWGGTTIQPALTDPYQIVQTEGKETIKLDRRTGEYWVLEDGIEVRRRWEHVGNQSLLEDKGYVWGKSADADKMTVRLRYSCRQAYLAWRIWPSDALRSRLESRRERGDLVEVDFYSHGGVRVLRAGGMWASVRWVQEGADQLLELQERVPCSATDFRDIETCRVRY